MIKIKIAIPTKTVSCTHFKTPPKRVFDFKMEPTALEKNTSIEKMKNEVIINKTPSV